MAALLVAMSIMAIMMTVAMPVWKQAAQREKETELVFRGLQYTHAIGMFQRKYANQYPPNIDVLVEQRFLRKKFKDPITNDDFAIIPVGQGAPGTAPQGAGQRGGATPTGRGAQTAPGTTQPGGRGIAPFGTPSAGTTAGISGVMSKSKNQSIRLYNGRGHYNEWAFVYTPQLQAPGVGGAPGSVVPGQRGQPGQQQPNPLGGGVFGGQGGRGNPNGPNTGRPGGPGSPNQPGGGRGFGPGPPPAQPIFPSAPRGRQ
jgi:type II secretory pathway pseudopilin PulG